MRWKFSDALELFTELQCFGAYCMRRAELRGAVAGTKRWLQLGLACTGDHRHQSTSAGLHMSVGYSAILFSN